MGYNFIGNLENKMNKKKKNVRKISVCFLSILMNNFSRKRQNELNYKVRLFFCCFSKYNNEHFPIIDNNDEKIALKDNNNNNNNNNNNDNNNLFDPYDEYNNINNNLKYNINNNLKYNLNNNLNNNKNSTLNNKNKNKEEEEWEGILYLGIIKEGKKLIEYFDQNFYSKNNLNEQNEIKQSLEKLIPLIDCSKYEKRIFETNSNWFLFYFYFILFLILLLF